jgi:hypothetical protein
MMIWILFIGIYVFFGLCYLISAVANDPWGGLILESPLAIVIVILGYPYFIIRWLLDWK